MDKQKCRQTISDQQKIQLARLIIEDATASVDNALVRQPKRLIPSADSELLDVVF